MNNFSILIATYNRAELLKETLDNLIFILNDNLSLNKNEIIIIDNNSRDNTMDIVSEYTTKYDFVKYIKEENQGLSFARNAGCNAALNENLVFLDDDVEVHKEWLQNLLEGFDAKEIAAIGGKVEPFKIAIPSWLPQEYYFLASVSDLGEKRIKCQSIMGGNCVIKKSVLKQVGMFNTSLGRTGKLLLGGEEIELYLRIVKAGYDIYYEPSAVVYHKIENKLNQKYIIDYSYWLGVSVAKLELFQKMYFRFFIKYIRALLFGNTIYKLKELTAISELNKVRFKIKRNYSKGYIRFWRNK